jgi:hypothetical protein
LSESVNKQKAAESVDTQKAEEAAMEGGLKKGYEFAKPYCLAGIDNTREQTLDTLLQ